MTLRDDIILQRFDRLEEQFGQILAETAATRVEVRFGIELQKQHEQRDIERFAEINSDIREIKSNQNKADSSTRTLELTQARAEGVLEAHAETGKQSGDWKRGAALILFGALLSALTALAMKFI